MDLVKHRYLKCVFINFRWIGVQITECTVSTPLNGEAKEHAYTCHNARSARQFLGQSLVLRIDLHLHVTRSGCFKNHISPRLHFPFPLLGILSNQKLTQTELSPGSGKHNYERARVEC